MVKLDRSVLMKIHMLLAAFILPVAFMFFTTGALYTWSIKGNYNTETYKLVLVNPLKSNLPVLIDLATKELDQRNISMPTGVAKIKEVGTSFMLEWTGSNLDIILQPTTQPLIAELKVKKTSWYRQFVQLHKAKGGKAFKVYAVILAISLLTLLITGFIMAMQMPKYRSFTLTAMGLGIVMFVAMVLVS